MLTTSYLTTLPPMDCPHCGQKSTTGPYSKWVCNQCRGQFSGARMHCAKCSIDLCKSCRQATSNSTGMSTGSISIGNSTGSISTGNSTGSISTGNSTGTSSLTPVVRPQSGGSFLSRFMASKGGANVVPPPPPLIVNASKVRPPSPIINAADLDLPPWGDGVVTTTPVLPGSLESIECLAALTPTLPPNLKLQGIEKIQNSLLYRRFHTLKRRIASENNGDSNTALAMHGTKGIPPRDIALDEHGIDMRFGNSGCFFGRASYFSYDTEYVIDNYAHATSGASGTKQYQFLVCEVSRGNAEARQMSKQIVRPSPGFHCIEGDVTPTGVKAVMCYELHQAYPRYLVTYLRDATPP